MQRTHGTPSKQYLRGQDAKDSDKNLKRARFEISSEEDHEDQGRIKCLKALTSIFMTKGASLHKAERMEAKLTYC